MTKFSAFLNDETGAVTVDWVVLTAAVVGLGLLSSPFVRPAVLATWPKTSATKHLPVESGIFFTPFQCDVFQRMPRLPYVPSTATSDRSMSK
jgi:hypothetical protein